MRALVVAGASGSAGFAGVRQRLERLGVDDVQLVPPGDPTGQLAAIAEGLAGRTLVLDAELIVAQASLGQLVDDPAVRSGALVCDVDAVLGTAPPVRVGQRRIASAGSGAHEVSAPSAAFLGAFVVADRDAQVARRTLLTAVETARFAGWEADPVDVALVALVRGQVAMSAVTSVGPALRGGSPAEREAVEAELAGLDEARVLLERANRPDDGFYSTYVLRRASKPVTALALRLGLRPNQISVFSLFVGLTAAVCFALGTWPGLLAGALLMQASLIIDCVDGEVARFTRTFSDLGAWIDAATDRVKEYAAYAGLAAGAMRNGEDIWMLAALVMVMQTVRHVGDYDFSRVQRVRESWVPARPLLDPSDGGAAGSGATLERSAQLNRDSRVRWTKKVLHMPIGERWLVLSVGAVVLGPRLTFVVLLGLGLLALAYTTAGRILRARTWRHPADRSGCWLLEPQLDLGPLGEPIWNAALRPRNPLARAFGWAWPASMRVVELGVVWLAVAAIVPAEGAWLFAWLFVVAFHHYDTLYRALGGSAAPRWLVWGGLGWEGRTLLVVGAWALGAGAGAGAGGGAAGGTGASALTWLLSVGSVLLGALFVVVASVQWVGSMRRKDVPHA